MKNHTYKSVEFKCSECDFLGSTECTMDVHMGKEHSDNLECGLCAFKPKDKEQLETHQLTCIIHAKQNRFNEEEIDETYYRGEELFPDL